jgi:hypothetical protein
LIRKPKYALSAKPFTLNVGSRGIVINAASKIEPPDSTKNISRVDVYMDGRPCKSLDAEDGSIRGKRIVLRKSRGKKAALLLEARDSANNLLAVCRLLF